MLEQEYGRGLQGTSCLRWKRRVTERQPTRIVKVQPPGRRRGDSRMPQERRPDAWPRQGQCAVEAIGLGRSGLRRGAGRASGARMHGQIKHRSIAPENGGSRDSHHLGSRERRRGAPECQAARAQWMSLALVRRVPAVWRRGLRRGAGSARVGGHGHRRPTRTGSMMVRCTLGHHGRCCRTKQQERQKDRSDDGMTRCHDPKLPRVSIRIWKLP